MTNFDLCSTVFSFLKKVNVETVIICAGARNAPFVFHIENESFKKVFFFEERSAAFFALGLIKQQQKPVAVITTSGTAAAELLPATIEAFYQGLPLILITADRPKSYRHTGAPQAIQQVGLYSNYVEDSYDWDIHTSQFSITTKLQKPIHLNICFDEPLMDKGSSEGVKSDFNIAARADYPTATASDFSKLKKPLVIVSQVDPSQRKSVLNFLTTLKAPVYLESLSQFKGLSDLKPYAIQSSDVFVKKLFQDKVCESVIRIGGVPTLRFWRDLEDKFTSVPVYNFTDLPFSGLARISENFRLDFSNFKLGTLALPADVQNLKAKDDALEKTKALLLGEFNLSEPACVRHLSNVIENQALYLGNSLPIREWDSFSNSVTYGQSNTQSPYQNVYANRGANGIDGQLSTYLGWSEGFSESWCVVGDLTAMYDLASLGLAAQMNKKNKKRIVIINNRGGHIFKRIFNKDQFLNSHEIEFQMWAQMWKWDYLKVTSVEDFQTLQSHPSFELIVEIHPQAEQTNAFWNAWDKACLHL